MKRNHKAMAAGLILLLALTVLTAGAAYPPDQTLNFCGTVQHIGLEGGFWGIIADDGKKYDPLNLADDFKREGLRVKVEAVVRNRAGFHMWGTYIEIRNIRKLDCSK